MRIARRHHVSRKVTLYYIITCATNTEYIIKRIHQRRRVILSYLSCLPCLVSHDIRTGPTIFMSAVTCGRIDIVSAMAKSIQSHSLDIALVTACTYQHYSIVDYLLNNNACVSYHDYASMRMAHRHFDKRIAVRLLLAVETDRNPVCMQYKQLLTKSIDLENAYQYTASFF